MEAVHVAWGCGRHEADCDALVGGRRCVVFCVNGVWSNCGGGGANFWLVVEQRRGRTVSLDQGRKSRFWARSEEYGHDAIVQSAEVVERCAQVQVTLHRCRRGGSPPAVAGDGAARRMGKPGTDDLLRFLFDLNLRSLVLDVSGRDSHRDVEKGRGELMKKIQRRFAPGRCLGGGALQRTQSCKPSERRLEREGGRSRKADGLDIQTDHLIA